MNWSLNWRSPNVFLTWLLLRHNINIFQVSCEGRHDLYTCHPLLNGFYGLRRMWRSACGPGLWPFQVFSQTTSPGSFPALLLFSPFLLPCSGWGHGKRAWGTSSLGLRSHNVPQGRLRHPRTLKAGQTVIPQEDGGTSGRKGFPTGSTTSLSPVKFEAIDHPLLPWFSFKLLFSSPTNSSFLKSQSLLKRNSKVHLLPRLRPSDDLHPHIKDSLFFFNSFLKSYLFIYFWLCGSSWLHEILSSCGKWSYSGFSLWWLLSRRA